MDIGVVLSAIGVFIAIAEFLRKKSPINQQKCQNCFLYEFKSDFLSFRFIFYMTNVVFTVWIISLLLFISKNYKSLNLNDIIIASIIINIIFVYIEVIFMIYKSLKIKNIFKLVNQNELYENLNSYVEKLMSVKSICIFILIEALSSVMGMLIAFSGYLESTYAICYFMFIFIYIIIFLVLLIKTVRYHAKYYITNYLVVRVNFNKTYNCKMNIMLNRNVKTKIENGMVYIYKRKNTLIYLFPQEYLIDIQTWYRIKKLNIKK